MSTYSQNLAIQLIATSDQAGQWGLTTNTNLGTLIESAISGYVTQAFADANIVLPMPPGADGGNGSVSSPVAARNMFITCTGTNTAQRNLFVPNNTKLYFISNQTTGGFGINVTTVGGTGVVVPSGQTALLVCNGVNVVNALTYLPSLILATPLTLAAPSVTNNTLTVLGASNAYTEFVSGSSTVGQSYGLLLRAGTNTTDAAIIIQNQVGSTNFLEIFGDGHGTLGPNGANNLSWTSAGAFNLAAPISSATTLVVTAFPGNYVTIFNSPNSLGNSFGPIITAGTNATDTALYIRNAAASQLYFVIYGDGHGQLGPTGSNALSWNTSGTFTFAPANAASTVVIDGAPNQYTTQILSNNSAGTSFGLFIGAGTNQSDVALEIYNGLQTSVFFRIFGDGSVINGVPTGAAKGPGSFNTQSSYINGDQIYSGIPASASTTISRADVNKNVVATGTITVPNGVFNEGDCVSVYNDSASAITLSAGITTMRLVGTSTTGSRTIAQRGQATIWFRSGTECVVSGGGVT